MSKYSALFTSVNLTLSVAPLILPMPFFDAGIVLSIGWMITNCLLSYNSALFIEESITKLRQYQYNERRALTLQTSLITSSTSLKTSHDQNLPAEDAISIVEQDNIKLDHVNQFQILFGPIWRVFPCFSVSVYLLGTAVSKCIMTGKNLSQVFHDIDYLRDFRFWVCLFFISGAVFSFRSIDNTKAMQITIIAVRVISLAMFLFGAIFLFCRDGIQDFIPKDGGVINMGLFVQLFSNSSLMLHHSLPNIVSDLRKSSDIRFVIRNAFIISGSVLLLIPITAIMAFGQSLGSAGDKLKYYNFDFQGRIQFIYWFTSFYLFLNIAAFSVYIIVIRSNFLPIYDKNINPKKFSKPTAITSIIILTIIIVLSLLLQQQIQTVLNFTTGIFGIFILFLMPSMEVYFTRKKTHVQGSPKNYITWLPIVTGIIGLGFMALNLYHIISDLYKK